MVPGCTAHAGRMVQARSGWALLLLVPDRAAAPAHAALQPIHPVGPLAHACRSRPVARQGARESQRVVDCGVFGRRFSGACAETDRRQNGMVAGNGVRVRFAHLEHFQPGIVAARSERTRYSAWHCCFWCARARIPAVFSFVLWPDVLPVWASASGPATWHFACWQAYTYGCRDGALDRRWLLPPPP